MDARERFGRDTHEIIGACIEVHRHLGPGLLESAYEECVAHEMERRGMRFVRQPVLPLVYKERRVERAYQPDFIVEGRVMLEIKAVQALLSLHAAQLRTYMKLLPLEVGLLVNFNVPALREHGIRRIILSSAPTLLVSHDKPKRGEGPR
jgi:GxxExxY protein